MRNFWKLRSQKFSKSKGLWLIPLLALSFLVQLPLPVHAASSFVQANGSSCSSPCTLQYTSSVTSGNVLVGSLFDDFGTSGATLTGCTDGNGDIFTVVVSKQQAATVYVGMCTATTTASNRQTITFTTSCTAGCEAVVAEYSGVSPSPSCTATGGSNTNTNSYTTGSTCTVTNLQMAVSSLMDGCNNNWTPGANFIKAASTNTAGDVMQYSNAAAASPTNFPQTSNACSNFPWALAGMVLDTGSGTVTTVTACNFFQLQCWWYPLLFMGLYSGFILMVSSRLNTSPRGKAHLFLSALTYGSLIAVIFGIMNIVFPLLMLILNTIIALRLRG